MSLLSKNFRFVKLGSNVTRKTFSSSVKPISMAYTIAEPPNISDDRKGVLVMHGLLGSRRNWMTICKQLAPPLGLKIYNLDARNHGDSPHTPEHSVVHLGEDIACFAQMQNLESVYTIGHSMGGRGMMYFALKYPHLVTKTIIVDISPVSSPPNVGSMTKIFQAMKEISMISPSKNLSKGRDEMKDKLLQALGMSERPTVEFILMNLRKNNETGEFYWAPNVDALLANMHDFGNFMEHVKDLPPYTGEILFICGSQSNFFNMNEWDAVVKMFPKAKVEWLDCGHLVHIEKSSDFLQLSSKFLC